jgi:hypothetical protein
MVANLVHFPISPAVNLTLTRAMCAIRPLRHRQFNATCISPHTSQSENTSDGERSSPIGPARGTLASEMNHGKWYLRIPLNLEMGVKDTRPEILERRRVIRVTASPRRGSAGGCRG